LHGIKQCERLSQLASEKPFQKTLKIINAPGTGFWLSVVMQRVETKSVAVPACHAGGIQVLMRLTNQPGASL